MSNSSCSYNRVDGSISGVTSLESGSQGKLFPRTKNDLNRIHHSSAYVPHNRVSRYATALINLVPIRFRRIPGSEIPLDQIGLFSSVSFNWLNEYISAGCMNGAKDKAMPTLASLDSCQINGTRIEGLWHAHVVERGQAGASVPRVAWQFVRTRVLVASLIYFLGMIISFSSPVILLHRIISTTEDRLIVYSSQMDELTKNHTLDKNGTLLIPLNRTTGTNETLLEMKNITNTRMSIDSNEDIKAGILNDLSHLILVDDVIIYTNIAVLVAAEIVSFFLFAWSASMNLRTATRLRSACLALAYKKLVRSSVRYEASAYQTMTYFIPNNKILYELIRNGPLIFTGPLILVLWSVFMWHSMGHCALIGIFVLVTLWACLILIAYFAKIFDTRAMNHSLERVSLMQEFIDNVFLAKVTLWDNYFFTKIQDVRQKELTEMRLGRLCESWSLSLVQIVPVITVSATMMACMLTNQQIDAANYVPSLVLIMINLKYCVRNSWLALNSISRGVISLNKLKTVLTLKDTDRFTDKPIDKNLAVTINHGHFTWDRDKYSSEKTNKRNSKFYVEHHESPALHFAQPQPAESLVDINFYVPKSKLIGICGSCGSGKTSLLLSLMGHLNTVGGHVTIDGTCSYVSQIPWLFEGTLKENILFGETLDSSWYYKTVRSCHLTEDIALLPGSDDTDLTTINLTLAQKQKIVLARAVYSGRDINLLDNPLADVEPEESKEIFEKSIVHALGSKTVIMISDRVQFLNRCDNIYVMKGGTIVEQGTHEELLQWNSEYTNLLESYMKKYKRKYCRSGEQINTSMNQLLTTPGPRGILSSTSTTFSSNLDTDEEMMTIPDNEIQEISMNHTIYEYRLQIKGNFYMRSAGGWYWGIMFAIMAGFFSFPIASSPLLFMYIAQGTITDATHILIILSAMIGLLVLLGAILLVIYNKIALTAARKIHEKWSEQLYRAQVSFLATISPSIVLNICSLNLQEVDSTLPRLMTTVLMQAGIIIFSVILLGVLSPWLLIPVAMLIIVSIFYVVYARGLTLSLHETVQADSVIPIYDHSVNTISGRAVIQAYHKEREFTKKFYRYCDNNSTSVFMIHAIKLWIEYRIRMLSALTLGIIVLMCASLSELRDRYEILGLAVICTFQLSLSIVHLAGAFTSAYASLLAISSVNDYVENIPKEKNCIEDLPDNWPQEPSIKFEDVIFTTKTNNEPMNITIGPGEKIALMDIEPTLKSSFVTSLYKFVEIVSGSIYVSNKNISEVRTERLRKSINFIPGDPVLFDGSIRYNLDPNDQRTDQMLMTALQKVFLWEKISRLSNKLESSASSLFNLWERKLLFLARALLNDHSKILIIEESVEHLGSGEDIVDNVLLDVFADYTVIAFSSRRIRYAKKTYYLEDGKLLEASAGRSDLSGVTSVDLKISIPKSIIQSSF